MSDTPKKPIPPAIQRLLDEIRVEESVKDGVYNRCIVRHRRSGDYNWAIVSHSRS